MSDLDDKLRELLDYFGESFHPEHEYNQIYLEDNKKDIEEAIAQIKQAFADAGYVWVPEISSKEVDGAIGYTVNGKYMTTGQQWYERFDKEFDKHLRDINRHYLSNIAPIEALYAARHASGLQ